MPLNRIIELYRLANKPTIESGTFSVDTSFNSQMIDAIRSIREEHQTARFEEILIDDNDILESDELPTQGTSLSFRLRLPTNSANKFYPSINDFIKTPLVSKGKIPDEFYIVSEDCDNESTSPPSQIDNLQKLCEIIKYLSQLANYHDEKTSEGYYKLVFVHADESISNPATVIDTKIKKEMLDLPKLDTSLLLGLCGEETSTNPHYTSQIGIFSVSITSFLSSKPADKAFFHLVQNWSEFLSLYKNNLATYLSGFAFHKAKKEVAEEELKIAEQFSKVIGDITGKLLSIPLSITAVIVVSQSKSLLESTLIIVGLLLASILIAGTVDNQQRQLVRINDAKNVVFNALEGRKDSYPEDLKIILEKIIDELRKNQTNLKILLQVFRFLSWVPVLIGIIVHVARNSNWLSTIMLL